MEQDILDNLVVFLDGSYDSEFDLFKKIVESDKVKHFVKDSYYEAITAREKEYPTGICGPVIDFAIPHTDPENLVNPFVAIIKPSAPVTFEPMGMAEEKVRAKLILMLGVNKDGQQIELLQKLMSFFSDEAEVTSVMNETDEEAIKAKMKAALS
ncbi:PTS sugar transporter subunit IIA [Enterococcus sp. 669A]|uniref:PTS sugar transporter subunit IIA n=1 Tax=Candidatus Enterococcus moelleringii TaxID=2815325 RepID=A0ABS3LDF3_9ENTE|nr:PTS sugar transporter subunit IIA [Enterococcus sp. 669A]MBO1307656.1 PTS sugar transporter subunit IIA [Enterococcus sp. 669A]